MDAIALDCWHGTDLTVWRGRWNVPALRIFGRVGSTNDVARELAEDGAAEGTLVLADAQTRGRGRRGRDWSAPAGASLSMSMILRPPSPASSRILTLRLGLAAARGLESLLPLRLGLKWPNDLDVAGRKVGGILCEAAASEDRVTYVVAGIGLNLRRPDDGWPAAIADRALSLEEAARTPVRAPAVVQSVVAAWKAVAAGPADTLSAEERAEFDARDALRGRPISVDGRPVGVADGVNPGGSLRVRRDGVHSEVLAGTVRTLDPSMEGGRT